MLRTFLEDFDLIKLKSDHCIFINHNISIIIAVYMNDLLLVESTAESFQNLKDKLKNQFEMINMNLAEDYLDIEISQQSEKIIFIQSVFILEILKCFEMKNSKSISTFMKSKAQLNLNIVSESLNNKEKKQYQQEIRFLIYLMLETRSDIMFAVEILSRFI